MDVLYSSEKPPLVTSATHPLLLPGIVAYLALVLIPIGLKLVGVTWVALWPWWKVLLPAWAPWPLVALLAVTLLVVRVVQGLRAWLASW